LEKTWVFIAEWGLGRHGFYPEIGFKNKNFYR